MAEEMKGRVVGGEGKTTEMDGSDPNQAVRCWIFGFCSVREIRFWVLNGARS
jgi:hypothetical protein